jgi:hypothetical protein
MHKEENKSCIEAQPSTTVYILVYFLSVCFLWFSTTPYLPTSLLPFLLSSNPHTLWNPLNRSLSVFLPLGSNIEGIWIQQNQENPVGEFRSLRSKAAKLIIK